MIIIGIAGGTGSGKTTVVRKLQEYFYPGEVVIIPQDSYYKDSSHIPVEERQNINFDHPNAFDWPLLSRHIVCAATCTPCITGSSGSAVP